MHKQIVAELLAKPNINIFDELVLRIESHFNRSVSSISEMKDRDSKKKKGDMFELFCKDWLLASGKYEQVWLLPEWHAHMKELEVENAIPKQDNGIDLIALSKDGYDAIQCKWRYSSTRKYQKVTWQTLSTFIGLCERSGPWNKYIVMTNCSGVTRKLPMTKKDKSICVQTFRNTTREHWMKLVGNYVEHRLSDDAPIKSGKQELSKEDLRAARLAHYS